jgi:hypothetical protein
MNWKHFGIEIDFVPEPGKSKDQYGDDARHYVAGVGELLSWIYRTKSGSALLHAIRYHNKTIKLQPYTVAQAANFGVCNALGGINMNFSARTFTEINRCYNHQAQDNRGALRDEILHHELVHAFRQHSVGLQQNPMNTNMAHYTDNEEFIAVLATNIYIADKTNKIKTGLRAGHAGFKALSPALSNSFTFYAESSMIFPLIDGFCKGNPGYTRMLAKIDATFNPIAAYYSDPNTVRAISEKAGSVADVIGTLRHFAMLD